MTLMRQLWYERLRDHSWAALQLIPTRSLQNNLNSICLSILAWSISIICIVSKIQAIKYSVAILLPRYKIIIAEVYDKINTLKR